MNSMILSKGISRTECAQIGFSFSFFKDPPLKPKVINSVKPLSSPIKPVGRLPPAPVETECRRRAALEASGAVRGGELRLEKRQRRPCHNRKRTESHVRPSSIHSSDFTPWPLAPRTDLLSPKQSTFSPTHPEGQERSHSPVSDGCPGSGISPQVQFSVSQKE